MIFPSPVRALSAQSTLRSMQNGGSVAGMPRTLIVDDSPTMRRMVIASLREVCTGGFVEAASGLEAIERLAVVPVAMVVLDLNMPDMHGIDVLNFVRRHDAFGELPVIVLTTRGDDASRTAALAAGATAYLTKPFDPQKLADKARALLTASQHTAASKDAHGER
jgi:two-component system chemotaxis response regulator CheY